MAGPPKTLPSHRAPSEPLRVGSAPPTAPNVAPTREAIKENSYRVVISRFTTLLRCVPRVGLTRRPRRVRSERADHDSTIDPPAGRSRRGLGTSLIAALVLIAGVVGPGAAATAAGDPPEVFDTSAFGTTERPISVFLSGFDPDGEAITYGIESGPSNGALTDDCSDGICTYTSDVGFVGTDTFTYSASDGDLTSTSATVTVTVQDDLPPDVFPGSFVTKVDQQVSIFLSGFDPNGDPVTFSVDTPPPNGSLDDCSTGSCTYTPDAGFIGIDTFTFTGSDGLNVSTPASVTIDVQEDVAPVASDGSSTTSVDTPVFLFLSAFDDNGDSLTYTVETGPTDGILADCSSGFCTYTPDAGFVGTDSLTFSATDGTFTSNTATHTIDVLPPCAPATCIDNGTVLLAVNPAAELNTTNAAGSAAGPGDAGLHFIPTGNEATSPGCLCEGWGAADATTGVTGYANVSIDGVVNLDPVSFTTTPSTALSEVTIDDTIGASRTTSIRRPTPRTSTR